MVATVFDN
jgi:hypothetical protein